jgi:ParB family chromosome partitioning protein
MVSDGTLSAGHARALLALESASGQEAAAALVEKRGLSVRKTEELVASLLKQPAPAPAADKGKPFVDYAAEVSRELSDALGRKPSLKEGRKGGRIELTYYDADDREALIKLLYTLKQK